MNIVKQSTGNVVLTDAAGNIQKVFVNVIVEIYCKYVLISL
jgi:hypothetical protein